MTSLLITMGDEFADKDDRGKRKAGQNYAGERMLHWFRNRDSDVEIVHKTLEECINGNYIVWLIYDDDGNAKFANLKNPVKTSGNKVTIDYDEVELDPHGSNKPIPTGNSGEIDIFVDEDGGKRNKVKKKMSVAIPYDRFDDSGANPPRLPFDDTYLEDISGDVQDFGSPTDATEYMLSSLTFRRCL